MLRITWRGVRQYPVRFVLSVLAVVLGIAFITGTFALRTSLSTTFDDIVKSSYVADVYVTPGTGAQDVTDSSSGTPGATGLKTSLADELADVPGVRRALPDISGSAVLIGRDGTPVTTGGAPTMAMALDPDDPGFTLERGHLPRNAGEIAVEATALERAGFAVGDRTEVVIGDSVHHVRISGALGYSTATFGAILMAVDHRTGVAAFAPDGDVQTISVYGDGTVGDLALARNVAARLGTDRALSGDEGYATTAADGSAYRVKTAAAMQSQTKTQIDDVLGFVSVFLLVFAVVALFVGGFIITNTFAMSVRQRMHEIAVLRAIGASPAQVFGSVVGQAVLVGVAGSVLGIAAGTGLVALVRGYLASTGAAMSGGIPLTTDTVLVSVVAGVLVSAVAAAIPALRAATIPPVAAMRDEAVREKPMRLRGIVGSVLVAGGIALAVAAGRTASGGLLGAGAAAVVVGALMAAPLVVPAALHVLAWPFAALIRPMGGLALGNVVRNPRRTAATAGALMIGMALVGGSAVLASSTRASMSTAVESSARSDFILQGAQTPIPADAVAAVEDLPGAGRVDTLYYGPVNLDGDAVSTVSGTSGLFHHSLTLALTGGSVATLDRDEVLVAETTAKDHHWKVGNTVTLAQAGPSTGRDAVEVRARIGGIVKNGSVIGTPVVLPPALYERLVPAQARVVNTLFVSRAPGTSVGELRASLVDAVEPYYVVGVMDRDEFVGRLSQQVDQVLYVLYALLGLSIVIAVLGIVNTLALSVIERTREIGLVRAVGLGRLQLSATITIESVLIAVFGAVLGLAIGVGLASFLPGVLEGSGLTELAIPWSQLGTMVGLAAVAGVVAAVWPAVRAARLPVLEAIAQE